MNDKYILSIDQSTSGTKAILFNKLGRPLHRVTIDHVQYYPQSGWVEHDAEEIYQNALEAVKKVLNVAGICQEQIAVMSITNQRETVLVWDKTTGRPIYPAVVWQCSRGTEICNGIEELGLSEEVREKTGLVLSPYFSASKIQWILNHVQGAREKAEKGDLLTGTMDCWLIWKLTSGRIHATDYSNACRTQLFNIKDLTWDPELLHIFDIPAAMMPKVKFSDEIFGFTCMDQGFEREIPISGIMGDSHAALFGQNCFDVGMAKATYGTGSSIMMQIGHKPLMPRKGLVTSIGYGMDGKVCYVFEGNINCTGDTIKWLVEQMGLLSDAKQSEVYAQRITQNDGVYLVPAFVGLSAPYWDSAARASITGMTRGTGRYHIIRAAVEAIAYQIKDVLDLMIVESTLRLIELRVDGGPTLNNFLMQFQADMLDTTVVRIPVEELSALGSALMAGLAIGYWESLEEIKALRTVDQCFVPSMSKELRKENYDGWQDAIRRTLL